MYYLSRETASLYERDVIGTSTEKRFEFRLPSGILQQKYLDSEAKILCPVTSTAFMNLGGEYIIKGVNSYSLHDLLVSFSFSTILNELLKSMYPDYSSEFEQVKMRTLLNQRLNHKLNLDTDGSYRLMNVAIRISEAIYNDGYVYTFMAGKSEEQENLFKYCGFLGDPKRDISPPKMRKQRLYSYLYGMYEEALFDSGVSSAVFINPWSDEEQSLTKEALARYLNVVVAFIHDQTSTIQYVVLKGTHLLAAYSNVYSYTSSCMQNCVPSVFLNYIANPDTVRILVGLTKNNKIISRRLIYKLQSGDSDWYAGRLYTSEGRYREAAGKFFEPLMNDYEAARLTFPTYGDEDFPCFMEVHSDMYEDPFNMFGYDKDQIRMEQCKHLYKLPPLESYEDVEYNFIDTTSTQDSACGAAYINKDNNYLTSFKIPFKYGDEYIYNNYRYFDDIDTIVFGDSIKVCVDERDSKCTYLSSSLKISFMYNDQLNSTTSLRCFLDDFKNGWYRESMDMEDILSQKNHGFVMRGIKMGQLCEMISAMRDLYDACDNHSLLDSNEYCITLHTQDKLWLIFEPIQSIVMSDYIAVGGALYIEKASVLYVDNGTQSGIYFTSPYNRASLQSIDVASLRFADPITGQISTLEEAGITDLDSLFPRYNKLRAIAGIDNLKVCSNVSGEHCVDSSIVIAHELDTDCTLRHTPLALRKDLVSSIKVFIPNAHLTSDSAMFRYDTVHLPKCLTTSINMIQLSTELYGEGQYTLPEQVVMSNYGWIYKVHARRLPDGTIVHKNAYNAIKVLNKFNISIVMPDTFKPITGVPIC